jgi:phosphodiesterase/alkaline phosphatase D-like protein
MTDGDGEAPVLVLGPLLRYVGETAATIWVETDRSCRVVILGHQTPTFEVAGHHYALTVIDGLEPGRDYEYQVTLDGTVCWPEPDTPFPVSVIRTVDPERPLRMVFGSCRIAELNRPRRWRRDPHEQDHGTDALGALALDLREAPPARWPDIMVLIGDQVYADEPGPATRQFISGRRDPAQPPGTEVADFTEYCFLYREAWSEPAVRWLLSVVPSAMIFDDHDVHDDWNTSAAWRRDFGAKPWWRDRIDGAYMSYWLYQHLGNLSPDDLARSELWRDVRKSPDAAAVLRDFARRADESPGAVQWSYRRTFGKVRLVVIDARSDRVLGQPRQMVSDTEWQWVTESVAGDWDHVVLATSLPVLLSRGIHDVEAWNEAVCAGAWGRLPARLGEKIRRALDIDHWPAFQRSFGSMVELVRELAEGPDAPGTITFIGGDVHTAYIAEVELGDRQRSRVFQIVCSPFRNPLAARERRTIRLLQTGAARALCRRLARSAGVAEPAASWRLVTPLTFDNSIAALDIDARRARVTIRRSAPETRDGWPLEPLHEHDLTPG